MAQEQRLGIVTPEAVVLQFETAGIGSRMIALALDFVIQGFLLGICSFALAAFADAAGASGWVGVTLFFFVLFGVLFGYPIGFETLRNGRTPGKAALGLRVVTKEGAPIRFRHAAVRGALQLVDFYLTSGAAAVLSMLFTQDNQRLGDLAAGTIVLRERSGAGAPRAVWFPVPPGYESYAATLDTAGLTGHDYGAVRSFLMRAHALTPQVRGQLAVQLAVPLAAKLHHTPPPGVSPEAFLACVAAVYQARQRAAEPAGAVAGASAVWPGGRSVWDTGPPAEIPPTAVPGPPAPPPRPGELVPPS